MQDYGNEILSRCIDMIKTGTFDNKFIYSFVDGMNINEVITDCCDYFKMVYGNRLSEDDFSKMEFEIKSRVSIVKKCADQFFMVLNGIKSGRYDESLKNGGIRELVNGLQIPDYLKAVLIKNILNRRNKAGLLNAGKSNFKLIKSNESFFNTNCIKYSIIDTNEYRDDDDSGYSHPGSILFTILDKKQFYGKSYRPHWLNLNDYDAAKALLKKSTSKIVFIMSLGINDMYRRNGFARVLLNSVIRDYGNYTIALTANSRYESDSEMFGDEYGFDYKDYSGLKQKDLIQMYKKFGFVPEGKYENNCFMIREPNKIG